MKKQNTKIKHKSSVMVVIGIILLLYVLFLFALFFWGLFASVKSTKLVGFNVFRHNELGLPQGWPWQWEWRNYVTVFDHLEVSIWTMDADFVYRPKTIGVGQMLLNTACYTFGGALVMTVIPALAAYATSKTNYFFSKIFDTVILLAMVIPIIGSYPAAVQLLNDLGLYDTWAGYYIQHSHCISVYYLIFQAMFKSVPYTYSEAAYIEGAGEYTVMLRVVMPLARTVIMTVFLIHFITIWNDYNTSLLWMPKHPSLAFAVYFLFHGNSSLALAKVPLKMAGSFILLIPILIVFLCFKNVIMQNLSMGGLKE